MEERTLKRTKKSFRELDEHFGKQLRTEATIIHLRISEIDRELSKILNLPQKPVQSYWNLTKKKQECERKLKNKRF